MLLYILGVLVIVVGLAISIGLHEIGHLVPAKLFGVKVTQYMIGFGRTIWKRRRGETEYGIKMLPLGGYISMIGMYPPTKNGEAPRESTTGFLNSMTQDAREASAETIGEGEENRTFYRLAVWKRILIMFGGPFMNLVLAVVFYAIVMVGFGMPQYTTTLASVSSCVLPSDSAHKECKSDDPRAPGAAAGLMPGDTIISIDGTAITEWETIQTTIASSPGVPLRLEVKRNGMVAETQLVPLLTKRNVYDDKQKLVKNEDGSPKTAEIGVVGISPQSELVKQPLTAVFPQIGSNIQSVVGIVTSLPQRLVDVWNAAFGSEERDPNGPMSVVGVGRFAGEVASMDSIPVQAKVQTTLGMLASLNVALFVFNLIPLLPLDGGHILGALYEGARRRIAKVFNRPDPGPVDTAKMVPVTFAIVMIFGAMTLLLIYADLVKPISLFG